MTGPVLLRMERVGRRANQLLGAFGGEAQFGLTVSARFRPARTRHAKKKTCLRVCDFSLDGISRAQFGRVVRATALRRAAPEPHSLRSTTLAKKRAGHPASGWLRGCDGVVRNVGKRLCYEGRATSWGEEPCLLQL